MNKSNFSFDEYLHTLSQRIDWLITACSSTVMARENAREHLNKNLKEITQEIYNAGFLAGEKQASYHYDQRYRVMKYKTQEKTSKELRKEILDAVLKEYGLKDEKIKKKLVKNLGVEDENSVEEKS